jgi:hypothetical protein
MNADLAPLGAFLSFFLRFFLPFLSTVVSALRLPVAFLLPPLLSFADACCIHDDTHDTMHSVCCLLCCNAHVFDNSDCTNDVLLH